MVPLVALDMDGLLSRFAEAVLARYCVKMPREAIPWDIATPCGFKGIEDPNFWREFSYPAFWSNLEPHADGIELAYRLCNMEERGEIELAICTTAPVPGSMDGKQQWLDRYLPMVRQRQFVVGGKGQCSGPGRILLDDHDPNIEAWRKRGGLAVCVPRPWSGCKALTTNGFDFDPKMLAEAVMELVSGLAVTGARQLAG